MFAVVHKFIKRMTRQNAWSMWVCIKLGDMCIYNIFNNRISLQSLFIYIYIYDLLFFHVKKIGKLNYDMID